MENEIEDLRKKIEEADEKLRQKEKTLSEKFEGFGGSMSVIEGRIGSMEKVFKEFLPELSKNIRAMTSLVEKTKPKPAFGRKSEVRTPKSETS